MKNSFILYHSYKKHLSMLSNEQKGVLLDAIFDYSENCVVPELEPILMMAFNFIREDVDQNHKKWEEMKEVRSEAGKKGAEARWKKPSKKQRKIAKDGNRILPLAKDGKDAVNVSVNVSDNVNVNDNVNVIYKPAYKILLNEQTQEELSKQLEINISVVKKETEKMVDWLKSKGKKYKDYKAFARNWLRNTDTGKSKNFETEKQEDYGW